MKASKECFSCLEKLARQAATLAAPEGKAREEALEAGLRVIKEDFSYQLLPVIVAARLNRAVKEASGNPDPYREMKDKEIEMARSLFRGKGLRNGHSLKESVLLAALGNSIDFFRSQDEVRADIGKEARLAIDHISLFEEKLPHAHRLLYLADNAGEVFFDLPLVRFMQRTGPVTYVVKPAPVQNDATLEDLEKAGVLRELDRVITTGTETPGVDLAHASTEFMREFEAADLVVSKGMAYYETVSELPARGKVFFCLKAKCTPIAASLGVPLNSYVAMLR